MNDLLLGGGFNTNSFLYANVKSTWNVCLLGKGGDYLDNKNAYLDKNSAVRIKRDQQRSENIHQTTVKGKQHHSPTIHSAFTRH